MDDMRISPVSQITPVSQTPAVERTRQAQEAQEPKAVEDARGQRQDQDTAAIEEGRTPAREQELDNVVAVSEHGDTLQVIEEIKANSVGETELPDKKEIAENARDEAAEQAQQREEIRERQTQAAETASEAIEEARRLQDIEVTPAATVADGSEPAAATGDAVADTAAAASQAPSSYAGVTDQQLEQMYRDGVISRQDYESEMEARDAKAEANATNNSELADRMSGLNAIASEGRIVDEAIDRAYSGESANSASVSREVLEAMGIGENEERSENGVPDFTVSTVQ